MTNTQRTSVKDIDDREQPGDTDLYRRAVAAYFRNGDTKSLDQPSFGSSGVERLGDKVYVVLRNINGLLAVYRLRSTGLLRRMKRWPAVFGN